MQRPTTVLSVKDGVAKLVQTPKKGLYFVLGTDLDRKPFLWLKATDFSQVEETVLKLGAAPSAIQKGRVYFDTERAAPVFCYAELAKEPNLRSPNFVNWVNQAASALCWGPANIFMGPLTTERGDDPGSNLDTSYSKSGLPTPSSALGELIARDGGISKASVLTERLARNVRDAQRDEEGERVAIGYDRLEWTTKDGKKVRKGRVELEQTVLRQVDEKGERDVVVLSSPEDSEWDPTKKVPQGRPRTTKPVLSEEKKNKKKEEGKSKTDARANKVVEEADLGGMDSLFGSDD